MGFIHSYCPACGGEIVTGSDGTIWESTCCCDEREPELELDEPEFEEPEPDEEDEGPEDEE